jgi:uncharacterized protein YbjT (DUF2867 family)
MRIAVAGGTGVVGRYVVRAAEQSGHDVVVMARSTGVDLRTGVGLSAALEGVEVIVDTVNSGSLNRTKATAFFTEVTRRMQGVGAAQGVSRLVTLSIVGLERVPGYGYYRAKLAHEAAAKVGPLPATIVRATQFYEFPAQMLDRVHLGPLALMPRMKVRPVAARSVGDTLAEIATRTAEPATIELAGPEEADLVSMAQAILRRRPPRSLVIPLRIPGGIGRAMRAGALLPSESAHVVGPSFSDWLLGEDVDLLGS